VAAKVSDPMVDCCIDWCSDFLLTWIDELAFTISAWEQSVSRFVRRSLVSSADLSTFYFTASDLLMLRHMGSKMLPAHMISSADQFCIISDSVGCMGKLSDAEGSVGAITFNGERFQQVCLVSAFRGFGLEVPYTCDGPFWAKRDGNKMLAPYGLEVIEVERQALGRDGFFVFHSDYHFVGCTIRGNAIFMHDRVHGHSVTELIQRADIAVLHDDIRVFQLFVSATGLPADPRIVQRGPKPTPIRAKCESSMPPASVDDWVRRERHRESGVDGVKRSKDNHYQLVTLTVAGGSLDARSKPATPDPHDATLSKRKWEEAMQIWRHKLRCAAEKAMAPSESRDDDTIGGTGAVLITEHGQTC